MSKKIIEVYDDLLHPHEADLIEKRSLDKYFPWFYKHNIAISNKGYAPGFGHFFLNDDLNGGYITSSPYDYSFFYLNILYKLSQRKNILIDKIHCGRLFMHLPGPKPSQDLIHTDFPHPHWVCLYYVTDSDGDTILFEDDRKTEITKITPKKGRIVFFDGSIPHCSSRPVNNTRVIVNFDFSISSFGEEKKN